MNAWLDSLGNAYQRVDIDGIDARLLLRNRMARLSKSPIKSCKARPNQNYGSGNYTIVHIALLVVAERVRTQRVARTHHSPLNNYTLLLKF